MPDSPHSPKKDLNPAPRKLSRRQFGQASALAGTLSLPAMAWLAASEGCRGTAPTGADRAGNADTAAQEVEAKLANIVRKYGDRLSKDQREHLRRILIYNERMLASVRAFTVKNGDPPASVLRITFAADASSSHPSNASLDSQSRDSAHLAPEKS